MRQRDARVLSELKNRPADEILLCSVVLAELWYGVERSEDSRRAANRTLVDSLASRYESLPFDNQAARHYASIRAHLAQLGAQIGPNDMLIAGIARSRNVTLVTHNTQEFNRVAGLAVEDWQSA